MKFDLVVIDWGIGGLSVYKEIIKVLPRISILYISDSGYTPYGKTSRAELRNRIKNLVDTYHAKTDANTFIIACNAASTVLPDLQKYFNHQGLFVTGVIDRGIDLVKASKFRKVGVIGGRRTILSQVYTKSLRSRRRKVRGRIAQPLSALIENGNLKSKHTLQTLRRILRPLHNCDALLLACTHYPALASQIKLILPSCALLDPAKSTARFLKLSQRWPIHRAHAEFITSGSKVQMKRAALAAFTIKIKSVGQVDCTF